MSDVAPSLAGRGEGRGSRGWRRGRLRLFEQLSVVNGLRLIGAHVPRLWECLTCGNSLEKQLVMDILVGGGAGWGLCVPP